MNRKTYIEAVLLFILSLITGFLYTYLTHQGFFAQKKASIHVITLLEAKEYFDHHSAVFIDARSEYEFKDGHIQGAISMPLHTLGTSSPLVLSIPRDTTIIVYCDGSECHSSFEVAEKLLTKGYSNIKVFFGGWQEWKAAGFPISE